MGAELVGEAFILDHNQAVHDFLSRSTIDDLYLQGSRVDLELATSVMDLPWERSITAPASIEIPIVDETHELREKHLPKDQSEQAIVNFGDYEFVVAKFRTDGPIVTLTCEDGPAGYSRRYNKSRKTTGKQTRPEFCFSMFREIVEDEVPVYCPLLHQGKLPIRSKAAGKTTGHSALTTSDRLKVKGEYADTEQLRFMSEVLRAAEKYSKNNLDAMVCCIMCIIPENEARNRLVGAQDHDSVGGFQQRKSQGWKGDLTDPDRQVKNFLLDAPTTPLMRSLRHRGGRTLGQCVQQTQLSGTPGVYDEYKGEAIAAVKAYRKSSTGADARPNVYTRGQQGTAESTWTAASRLFDEVNWRLYSDFGLIVMADEIVLLDSAPTPEVDVRLENFILGETDIDWGKSIATVELTVIDWDVPLAPGLPMPLVGAGMANGTWLIEKITGSMGSPVRQVTLRRPAPPKPEPSTSEPKSKKVRGKAPNAIEKLLKICQTMSDNTPGYLLGGGHGLPLGQINSHMKLDCSSSTSYALWKAGLFPGRSTAIVSGDFDGWGKAGGGRYLTVYYNAGHVFMIFTCNGKRYRFDTGGPGGGRGPKLHEGSDAERPTGGFNTRHYGDL